MRHTWIVIADGAHAKVLEYATDEGRLAAVPDMSLRADLPRTREVLTDRPGRSFDSLRPSRHAMVGRSDPRRELKRDLVRLLAERLAASLADKRYHRLVLVAPPGALGDLRTALAPRVRATVVAELAQDLVKTPHRELPHHLLGVLPPAGRRRVAPRAPAAPRGRAKK